MPFQKDYCCAGNHMISIGKDRAFILLGIIGSCILLYGLSHPNAAQPSYIIGSTCLLCTAIYFHLFYFIALELILIAGHTAILLGLGPYIQMSAPILLCFQLVVYYIISDNWNNKWVFLAIIGIALLSIGFAWHHALIFFFGSLFIAIYAWLNVSKIPAAAIWAVTNSLFAIISLYRLIII